MPKSHVEKLSYAICSARSGIALTLLLLSAVIPPPLLNAQNLPSPITVKRCWGYAVSTLTDQRISSDGSRVFLPEDAARVEAISITDGTRIWYSDLGGEIVSNIVENNASVFVTTAAKDQAGNITGTSLRSLSKETGITNWVAELPAAQTVYLGASSSVVVAISDKGKIATFDGSSGARRWNAQLAGAVSAAPYFAKERFIVPTDAPDVTILSTADGAVIQKRPSAFRLTAVFLLDANQGASGDERGNLTLFNVGEPGTIWKLKHGAGVSDIGLVDETLLVTSNDNFVYAVAISNGNVRWKKRQQDRVFTPGVLAGDVIVVSSRTGGISTMLEGSHGKVLDQIQLQNDSAVIHPPLAVGNSILIPATNEIAAYSLNGCSAK